jgi:hypothetical protein
VLALNFKRGGRKRGGNFIPSFIEWGAPHNTHARGAGTLSKLLRILVRHLALDDKQVGAILVWELVLDD